MEEVIGGVLGGVFLAGTTIALGIAQWRRRRAWKRFNQHLEQFAAERAAYSYAGQGMSSGGGRRPDVPPPPPPVRAPNPGSDEAIAQGCICPILDNCHGRGYYAGRPGRDFIMVEGCPLHGQFFDQNPNESTFPRSIK